MAKRASRRRPATKKNRYVVSRVEKRANQRKRVVFIGSVFSIFLLVLLMSAIFVYSYGYLITTPYLSIRRIKIVGCEHLSPQKVKKVAGVREGQNLLAINLRKARLGIEKMPWVKSVTINRNVPDEVLIEITERKPMALIRLDKTYLIDSSGRIIVRGDRSKYLDCPLVVGLEKQRVLRLGKVPDDFRDALKGFLAVCEFNREWFRLREISEIYWSPVSGFSFYLGNGKVLVRLGKSNFPTKFTMLKRVLNEISEKRFAGKIREIDIRCKSRVFISRKDTEKANAG